MMLMHNAYARKNDPSSSVFPSHTWLSISFHPLTPNSHQLLQHRCFSACPPVWSAVALHFKSFQSVQHKLNILSAAASPTTSAYSHILSVLASLPLFILRLLSHSQVHVSIKQGFYVSTHSGKLLFLIMACLSPSFLWFSWTVSVPLIFTQMSSVFMWSLWKLLSGGQSGLVNYMQVISII